MKTFLIPLFALVSLGFAFSAQAFQLRTTSLGDLVRWRVEEVEIGLDPSLADLGEPQVVQTEVISAFATWKSEAELDIVFIFVEKPCAQSADTHASCIYATTGEQDAGGDVGASTKVSFIEDTGEIVGADIAFFSQVADWTTNGEAGALDVYSVALHEAGHFLGLEHTTVPDAAMYAWTDLDHTGSTELHPDDRYAAQALYDDRAKTSMNCSVDAPGSSSEDGGLLGVLFALLP